MRKVALICILSFVVVVLIASAARASTKGDGREAVQTIKDDWHDVKVSNKNNDLKAMEESCKVLKDDVAHIKALMSRPKGVSKRDWETFQRVLDYTLRGANMCIVGSVDNSVSALNKANKLFLRSWALSSLIPHIFN